MPWLVTDAVVLHSFNYLESSRIYRIATRGAGLQSVIGRGARGSRRRFGSSMGLFATGVATLDVKEGNELHTLESFDVQDTRGSLAADYGRFLGASMLSELVLRFAGSDSNEELYETIIAAFDTLVRRAPSDAAEDSLAAGWGIVAALGFAPSLADCASCHVPVAPAAELPFSHRIGGVLCERCAVDRFVQRRLPADARSRVAEWLGGGRSDGRTGLPPDRMALRAHARLLREFVSEHLGVDRPMKAFAMWEESL
jgi:DNA repair protein RecO (recombination protein O)